MKPAIVSAWILFCWCNSLSQLGNYIANPLKASCIIKQKLRTARINSAHPVHAL